MHLMFPEATVCGRIHYVEVTVHIQSQIHAHRHTHTHTHTHTTNQIFAQTTILHYIVISNRQKQTHTSMENANKCSSEYLPTDLEIKPLLKYKQTDWKNYRSFEIKQTFQYLDRRFQFKSVKCLNLNCHNLCWCDLNVSVKGNNTR